MEQTLTSANNFTDYSQLVTTQSNETSSLEHGSAGFHKLYMRIWVSIFSGIIFITGVGGNVLVPLLFWKNKELRNSTNIFLLNLALADLLVLIICLPTAIVELFSTVDSWILGRFLCHFVPFLEISVTRASVLTLTIISVERYVVISNPLRSSSICTRHLALGISLCIWPVSLLAAGPVWTSAQYFQAELNVTRCYLPFESAYTRNYFLISIGVFYFLPFCFLTTLYFCIVRRLLDRTSWSRRRNDNIQWKGRKQVAFMLWIVVFVFFVCLLPFNVLVIVMIKVPPKDFYSIDPDVFYNVLYFCRIMIFINSAVNPIIYNAMSAKFRSAFIKLLSNVHNPSNRLLRRQSTLTTSIPPSSGSSRSISLSRRASLAIERRFSNASSRRSSDKPLIGRRSSEASSSSRKTSNSSSRKSSNSSHKHLTAVAEGEQDATAGQLSADCQNKPCFSSRLEYEHKVLFLIPDNHVESEIVYKSSRAAGTEGKIRSLFGKEDLFSSPTTTTNSAKKVSFDDLEVEKKSKGSHQEDGEVAPVAPPRSRRNKKRLLGDRLDGESSFSSAKDASELLQEEHDPQGDLPQATKDERNERYDRIQRDCKCNSRTITRCSFRKLTKVEVVRSDSKEAQNLSETCKNEGSEDCVPDLTLMYLL